MPLLPSCVCNRARRSGDGRQRAALQSPAHSSPPHCGGRATCGDRECARSRSRHLQPLVARRLLRTASAVFILVVLVVFFFGPGECIGEAAKPGPASRSGIDDPEGGDFDRDIEEQSEACWLFDPSSNGYVQVDAPLDCAAERLGFIPSVKFAGAKAGWVFKSGTSGLGYYEDKPLHHVSGVDPGPVVLALDLLILDLQDVIDMAVRRRAPRSRKRKRPLREHARHRGTKAFVLHEEIDVEDISHRELCEARAGVPQEDAVRRLHAPGAATV